MLLKARYPHRLKGISPNSNNGGLFTSIVPSKHRPVASFALMYLYLVPGFPIGVGMNERLTTETEIEVETVRGGGGRG